MPTEPADPCLTLSTIVPAAAWKTLCATGRLRADDRRTDREFRPAYRWKMDQMRRRLPGYRGGYPLWAWRQPKPDLRRKHHLTSISPSMRIGFRAPADRVLLFDFDSWHSVLNEQYLALSEAEWDAREQRERDVTGLRWPNFAHLPPDMQTETRESWVRIFDLDCLLASEWCTGGQIDRIQAVLEAIRLEWVVATTPFSLSERPARRAPQPVR